MSMPADWEALARYLDGESSPEEIEQIEARLSANPVDRELLDALDTLTKRMADDVPSDLDVEAALARGSSRGKTESPASMVGHCCSCADCSWNRRLPHALSPRENQRSAGGGSLLADARNGCWRHRFTDSS